MIYYDAIMLPGNHLTRGYNDLFLALYAPTEPYESMLSF